MGTFTKNTKTSNVKTIAYLRIIKQIHNKQSRNVIYITKEKFSLMSRGVSTEVRTRRK